MRIRREQMGLLLAFNLCVWPCLSFAKPASHYPGWVQKMGDNKGQGIEYWVHSPCTHSWMDPIILVPDMTERAEHWAQRRTFMTALDTLCPKAIYAVSLRGRGASDSPKLGWEPEDHHTDIATVARSEKLERFHVLGDRVGAGYALGYGIFAWMAIESLVLFDSMPGLILATSSVSSTELSRSSI